MNIDHTSQPAFGDAQGDTLFEAHISERLKGYFLVRSYARSAEPYQVISDLPEDEALRIALENDPIRGSDNYQQRLRTERWLREQVAGGKIQVDKATPVYFAFTKDPGFIVDLTSRTAPHKEVMTLPAHQVDLSNWSFTMDDHFFADFSAEGTEGYVFAHAFPHPLHGRVLSAEELIQAIDTYGYPQDPYKNNFEAQMWAPEATRMGLYPNQQLTYET